MPQDPHLTIISPERSQPTLLGRFTSQMPDGTAKRARRNHLPVRLAPDLEISRDNAHPVTYDRWRAEMNMVLAWCFVRFGPSYLDSAPAWG